MNHPDMMLLYVSDPAANARFFHQTLGAPIVEQSSDFAMLVLSTGLKLGLWARGGVRPAAEPGAGGGELCIHTESDAATDAAWDEFHAGGAAVLQARTRMDFGYTFVVASPEGHRIRVFSPPANG